MQLELKKEIIEYREPVCDTAAAHEVMQEVVVPDALSDVSDVLLTQATVLLRGKDSSAGRITVTGIASAAVLVATGDDKKVKCVTAELPFTISAEAAAITADSDIVAAVSVSAADTRMINPRKLLIKLTLMAAIRGYEGRELAVSCSTPENEAGLETLCGSAASSLVRNVGEKTFVISDEFVIPDTKPAIGELLCGTAELLVEDLKCVSSKLIISGRASARVLWLSESGTVDCDEFSTMFSQIVELPSPAEGHELMVNAMTTGLYFSLSDTSSGRAVTMELHGVLQCETAFETELTYLSDAFSTKCALELTEEKLTAKCSCETSEMPEAFRGSVPAAVAPERVVMACFRLGRPSCVSGGGKLEIGGSARVSILYLGADGRSHCASGSLDIKTETPAEAGRQYSVSFKPGDEIYATPAGMEFDVRLPVTLQIRSCVSREHTYISGIDCRDAPQSDTARRPSLILHRTQAGEDLWKLAKKYRSTTAAILDANALPADSDIEENSLLIIPKVV